MAADPVRERHGIMRPGLQLALIAAGLLLAGCPSTRNGNQAQLASACQIVKCTCLKPRPMLPQFTKEESQEVLWRQDGTAYCPEGYALERKDARSMYDRPLY